MVSTANRVSNHHDRVTQSEARLACRYLLTGDRQFHDHGGELHGLGEEEFKP